jgi:methylated-DNA-protein-cysteine methyltransferase-like protein
MERSSDRRGKQRIVARSSRKRPGDRSRESRWQRFYRVVRRIPRGRVSTYGEVADRAGLPRFARHVGYALSALRGSPRGIPWQRVLGKRGRLFAGISLRDPIGAAIQQELLMAEGVEFDAQGRVCLERFGWRPKRAARQAPPSRR